MCSALGGDSCPGETTGRYRTEGSAGARRVHTLFPSDFSVKYKHVEPSASSLRRRVLAHVRHGRVRHGVNVAMRVFATEGRRRALRAWRFVEAALIRLRPPGCFTYEGQTY